MDLVADLLDAVNTPHTTGVPCRLGTAMLAIGEEDRPAVLDVVLGSSVSAAIVAERLARNGVNVAAQTVRYHRRGQCVWCQRNGLTRSAD